MKTLLSDSSYESMIRVNVLRRSRLRGDFLPHGEFQGQKASHDGPCSHRGPYRMRLVPDDPKADDSK